LEQSKFYNPSFPKISLVTTKKHIEKAHKLCPPFWGIILAQGVGTKVSFKHVRKAGLNPEFCKKTALLTLWKVEMLDLLSNDAKKYKYENRNSLANTLAKQLKKQTVTQSISKALVQRNALFQEPCHQ